MPPKTNLRSAPPKKVIQQATAAAILAASFAAPLSADAQQAMHGASAASLLVGSCLALKSSSIETLQKYCLTSWRQAGISAEDWDDCTHDVVVELLSRLPKTQVHRAIDMPDSEERRELVRSIWCVTQRWRRARARQPVSLEQLAETEVRNRGEASEEWESLEPAIQTLNTTQQQILQRLRNGDSIAEIADALQISAARVSDQKYKAVKKLQKSLNEEMASNLSI